MYFISTRGEERVTAAQAIVQGLAKDGGLFVPETFPAVSREELEEMLGMSYAERAAAVLSKYLEEYDKTALLSACEKAYAKFDGSDPAPLVKISEGVYILELFHGPTCAFKDMALTLLPYLLRTGCDIVGMKEQILILVATSGDTGKAALEGFKDAEGIKIMVFYPDDGVSKMQKLQMCTQEGNNVNVVAVKGNFDDCQTAVKKIFNSEECKAKLLAEHTRLSSANSINFGRLAPQIAYYFSAYLDLISAGQIEMGDEVNFTVPTGNFGNILAAYYAKKMGLPVGKLVCASNKNNVLTDFIRGGEYRIAGREFHKTMSPSMDILISSNLERFVFELSGRNAALTAERMRSLAERGTYSVSEEEKQTMQEAFFAGFSSEDDTVETIYDLFSEIGYPMDTHTGVAMSVAREYFEREKDDKRNMVIVSTASPYKFPQDVLYALTGNDVKDSFKGIKRINALTAMEIPKSLSGLRDKPVRFKTSVPVSKAFDEILNFLQK